MVKHLLILFMFSFLLQSYFAVGQEVEHNYPVGTLTVNCDSLSLPEHDLKNALETVKNASYRDSRQFKLTRKQGLQRGLYFLCDGLVGYLIIRFDNVEQLYLNISKETWNAITTASDPEGVYLDNCDRWEKYK